VANFFLDQGIGIEEQYISVKIYTNTFQLKFFIWHENCGRHRWGGLWALEWATIRVTNLRCVQGYAMLRTRLRNL